jgi:hypothetical protein
MTQAHGTFDVTTTPVALDEQPGEATLGRFSLDKQFHGDLEATGQGEMLTAGRVEGSAGYVAIERVTGTLHGRRGAFVLQHTGTMSAAGLQLTISVVPETGTGALAGLRGQLTITVVDGEHRYALEYELSGG